MSKKTLKHKNKNCVFILLELLFGITILVMLNNKIFHPFSLFILTQITILAPAIADAAGAAPVSSSNVGVSVGGISSLLHASFIVQIVILILVALSILCWAIGWSKYQQFKLLKEANEILAIMAASLITAKINYQK